MSCFDSHLCQWEQNWERPDIHSTKKLNIIKLNKTSYDDTFQDLQKLTILKNCILYHNFKAMTIVFLESNYKKQTW